MLDAIAQAIQARKDLTLLMDTELLKAGDAWRARINLWLGACDVAVLVLSEKALESPWVVYEASVLSYRNRGGDFLIIPVLIGDPEGKLLKDRRLDAQNIKETQVIHGSDPAAIAQQVVAAIPAECDCERPIDRFVDQFRIILDTVPSTLLDKAAAKLSLKLPWEPSQDKIRPFVEKLAGAAIDDAAAALYQLSGHYRKSDPDRIGEMVNLVAASWVNPKALTLLPEVCKAVSGRAVALNAALQRTAETYHVAASGGDGAWHFIPAGGDAFGEPAQVPLATEICELVEQNLRDYMKYPQGDLVTQLQTQSRVHTFVVGIAAVGFTAEVIEEVQKKFPTVTFFFLTGSQTAPAAAVERKLVTPITPDLIPTEEDLLKANLLFLHNTVIEAQKFGARS